MKQIRQWLATKLVRLAFWLEPESPEVMEFWGRRYMDFIISGKSSIKIVEIDQNDMV